MPSSGDLLLLDQKNKGEEEPSGSGRERERVVGESLQEVMMLRESDIQGDFHKYGLD